MDKKSIIGIAVVALLFFGFAYLNTQEQKKYQEEMAAWQAYQDSVALATRPVVPVADSVALTAGGVDPVQAAEAARERRVAALGEYLAAARDAEEELFVVENDVMAVTFSTRGGQIRDVLLKDYTKYAPRGERNIPVSLMDPATARFDLSFYVKNGLNNVKVNTMEYVFTPSAVETTADGARAVRMRLPISETAALEYEYLIYDTKAPARDYLVDFDVRLVNMAAEMANQTSIGIDWSNTSYQNERGFKNENMYTTVAYRFPGESSIEELSMSDEERSKEITTSVNWVAFKQHYFSSVFIAPQNLSYADVGFTTAQPGSGYIKDFSARMTVPYTAQTTGYDFAFYFGPNEYSILKKVGDTDAGDGDLYLERLIPLGWGIFGWINRWCVIPVFDFLRNYIPSFGIIILILAVLVRLVISPLTYKSYVSMAKMRLIKPQVDELAKKYPKQEDAMKRQQATMELYKKAGINPMGGCIPMLIQMPILIAMFRFFPASIELRGQSFLWAGDLSSYDSVLNLPFSIPFYGDHVSLFALAAPDGGHEVHDALSHAAHAAVLVQRLFERSVLLLPALEPADHRPNAHHPPHGRRYEDPGDHAGQCGPQVERQEVEVPAALRGAAAPAGGSAARQAQITAPV